MKKIICILFIITIIMLSNKSKEDSVLIPDNSIRFRIIANSNSESDQKLKLDIKEEIENSVISTLSMNDYKTADESIKASLATVDSVLRNYNLSYDISYGQNYFPKKTYKGVIYPEGNYQSLVITLGEGLGDNWWCVLFPPLCLLEADESNYNEVDYQLYIDKILDKYTH